MSIERIQQELKDRGLYSDKVDGLWGKNSEAAFQSLLSQIPATLSTESPEYKQLRRDEGEKLYVYDDDTGRAIAPGVPVRGYATIGIGVLIDQRRGGGISAAESAYLFNNRYTSYRAELLRRIPWAAKLDRARLGVLCNMAYQMGVQGVLGFTNTLAMIERGDYDAAAKGMLNSLWARQTPARAKRLSEQMRTGQWA